MASISIRPYTASFSSLRGLTRKTFGAWQDPDGASSRRQQFIPHNRDVHSSPTRSQHAQERSSGSRIGGSLRQCTRSCGLQYAKFHGHLETIATSADPASPRFESHEVSKWPAKAYGIINFAMKLEPVLRQLADGFNFEFRPTALLLSLGSRGHAFKSNVIGLGLSEVAHRRAAVSSDGAEAVDPAGTLTALLEEMCLELADFRAELRHTMGGLSGGMAVQRVQSHTASCSIMRSVTHSYRPANGGLYGEGKRPSFWLKSRAPHANLQRASFHSFSPDGYPEQLKFETDPFEMLLFGLPLNMSFWCRKAPLMASIHGLVTLDASTTEDVCLSREDPDQEQDGESCDTCDSLDPCENDNSLSPYIQMFGRIRLQDVLQPVAEIPYHKSLSQRSETQGPISEHIESGNPTIPTKNFSNNAISGSARVHLGDLYYENVTINQYYVSKDFNEPMIERFSAFDNIARNCNHIT